MRFAAMVVPVVTLPVVALAALTGCPASERAAPGAQDAAPAATIGTPAGCTKVGQSCEFSPGKLGTCVAKDDCNVPTGCFVCQSQH